MTQSTDGSNVTKSATAAAAAAAILETDSAAARTNNTSHTTKATATTAAPTMSMRKLKVIKGKSDWRQYRPLNLSNGLLCLLVHDNESKTTAMSACVGVGASSDPREYSGIAHFTEHMCFLGSKKYPGENEYKHYLSCHGGRSNASTSMSCTTYKFDIVAEHAEKAIDIFANFFISPLFTPSGTNREINAVDSENSKNLTSDVRRRLQVLKALADPTHHYSKFSTGNAKTLPTPSFSSSTTQDEEEKEKKSKEDSFASSSSHSNGNGNVDDDDDGGDDKIREAMLIFHKLHYRPDNIIVVIVGPQSLDQLQEWIVPRFESIQDQWKTNCKRKIEEGDEFTEMERLIEKASKDSPPDSYHEPLPPYNPAFRPDVQGGNWPVLVTTLPLKSMRKLVLSFPVPSTLKVPDQSPVRLISHLLGHEGPGSSFAILQDCGLINSMSVGSRIAAADQCLLQIDISLTEHGEDKWKDVVAIVFEHCHLVHSTAMEAATIVANNTCNDDDDGDDEGSKDDNNKKSKNKNDYKEEDLDRKKVEENSLDLLQRIWKENVVLSRMNFHNTSPGQAYSFAPALAQSIRLYGVEKCLSAGSMLGEGDEEEEKDGRRRRSFMTPPLPLNEVVDFSSRLIPENCIVERCSKLAWDEANKDHEQEENKGKLLSTTNARKNDSIFGLRTENWYGVEYYLSRIDPSVVSSWKKKKKKTGNDGAEVDDETTSRLSSPISCRNLHSSSSSKLYLPRPNRYIPDNLDLCFDFPDGPRIEKKIDPPNLVMDDSRGRLWHRLDDRYALPKSSLTLLMRTAAVQHVLTNKRGDGECDGGGDGGTLSGGSSSCWSFDHDASILSLILVGAFSDAMAQETYDADLAGLGWSLSKSSMGLTLRCYGYSDKLSILAKMLVRSLFLPGKGTKEDEEDDGSFSSSSVSSSSAAAAASMTKNNNTFLQEKYFTSSKDRVVRNLKSYFQSRRADSLALYYTDLLLSSDGKGVEQSLHSAEHETLEKLRDHHATIFSPSSSSSLSSMGGGGEEGGDNIQFDCLYSGNVTEEEARSFYDFACDTLFEVNKRMENGGVKSTQGFGLTPLKLGNGSSPSSSSATDDTEFERRKNKWIPGPFQRRLNPGESIQLHFQSMNEEEENGAVLMTFQSGIAGYKGDDFLLTSSSPSSSLSSSSSLCTTRRRSLRYTAAMRLLSHMLREPLFDELRTKQQLGYIVHSYYDVNFSTRRYDDEEKTPSSYYQPCTIPVDTIVVNILSRKYSPIEVAKRIDEFLDIFRNTILPNMPTSEIQNHSNALRTKLLKPIQKLESEVAVQFGKIQRYGPEVLSCKELGPENLPWDSVITLANEISQLNREDLLYVWDDVIANPKNRSRIVSHVYGKSFPMANFFSEEGKKMMKEEEEEEEEESLFPLFTSLLSSSSSSSSSWIFPFSSWTKQQKSQSTTKIVKIQLLEQLFHKRSQLPIYGDNNNQNHGGRSRTTTTTTTKAAVVNRSGSKPRPFITAFLMGKHVVFNKKNLGIGGAILGVSAAVSIGLYCFMTTSTAKAGQGERGDGKAK